MPNNLQEEISKEIDRLDSNKVLIKDVRTYMSQSLYNFIYDSIYKYIKGQNEHKGDIRERNLKEEIINETIDIFWYSEAQNWPSLKEK